MRSNTLISSAFLAASAIAAPTKRADTINEVVLQFALTLEHLEDVFYKGALTNFTEQDFMDAGYSADYYNNLRHIAFDEQTHVEFLESALTAAGVKPNEPCTYNFPYKDVPSFITLSSVIEGVGTSAYLGAAPLITTADYLTAAASILVTEAKHTSYQRAAIAEVPMANPFGTPLDPMSVFTIVAASFITSCPASNMPLPFTAFPTLSYTGPVATDEEPSSSPDQAVKRWWKGEWQGWHNTWAQGWHSNSNDMAPPSAGDKVTFMATKDIPAGSYLTFVSGLDVVSVKGTTSGKEISAAIPSQAMGQTYVFVTKMAITSLTDSAVLDGPAILEVMPAAPVIDFSES